LTVGETIADAFLAMYFFETACRIQVRAQAGGDRLIPLPAAIIANAEVQLAEATKGAGGRLAWPALLRKLDRLDPSYRS
jgi:ribulose-5-phosphate 4-epimerase/fuculose-1-phosphate aldolase